MNQPRIFVVHDTGAHDISDASRFGEIQEPLLDDRHDLDGDGRWITHRISSLLQDYRDEDYLLLIGDPVGIGIATAAAARKNRGRVNLLKWDNRKREYFPVTMNLNRDG